MIRRGCLVLVLWLGAGTTVWGLDRIVTVDGARLEGTVVEETETQVTLDTAYGRMHVPRLMIESMERGLRVEPVSPPPPPGWTSKLELSLLSRRGRNTEGSLRGAFKTARETPDQRSRVDGSYYYLETTATDKNNEDRLRLNGLQEWINPINRLSLFASGTYDYDSFKTWTHRFAAGLGMGYDFRNDERLKLIGRLGLGFRKDLKGKRLFDPESSLGVETEWQINASQRFHLDDTLNPSVTEGSYRNNLEAKWSIDVGAIEGLFLSIGTEYKFESKPVGKDPHGDVLVYGSLVWEF